MARHVGKHAFRIVNHIGDDGEAAMERKKRTSQRCSFVSQARAANEPRPGAAVCTRFGPKCIRMGKLARRFERRRFSLVGARAFVGAVGFAFV
jgi:hypothetical protein